eukprot:TRINITY_DN10151_c0_g1_i1.p2 TRINITY_DN10151_c0_g1~~TRINITY_DN10151_c0_g1_i1.p2  ORF type:complete len:107 (-),score=11.18 TRINITY_DN10151_c0_g1_i1:147-467(-)
MFASLSMYATCISASSRSLVGLAIGNKASADEFKHAKHTHEAELTLASGARKWPRRPLALRACQQMLFPRTPHLALDLLAHEIFAAKYLADDSSSLHGFRGTTPRC